MIYIEIFFYRFEIWSMDISQNNYYNNPSDFYSQSNPNFDGVFIFPNYVAHFMLQLRPQLTVFLFFLWPYEQLW